MRTADLPSLLVTDKEGNIFDIPELLMSGMEGPTPVLPKNNELIDVPYGSDIFMLPDRVPIGYDPASKEFVLVPEYQGKAVFPAAVFMAPAHMQFYLPAYREPEEEKPKPLPMYGYTAVGWAGTAPKTAGIRIDPDVRQDLQYVDTAFIKQKAPETLKKYPGNRLVRHLVENCALCYGCPAARNFVLGRWECPVPTSKVCNAGCVGCISYQPKDTGVDPAQERICFTPNVDEIVEFAAAHLETAERPVISFGQGCEGEPLTVAGLLTDAVREIRKRTEKGIINLNTNGSMPDKIDSLCDAGLDSVRISINSAQPELYTKYYNPKNYHFEDVLNSIKTVYSKGKWVSLNYFIFPGVTDRRDEMDALCSIITDCGVHMVQTRNTNIDPLLYWQSLGFTLDDENKFIGLRRWLKEIGDTFPKLQFGYFNPSLETMRR